VSSATEATALAVGERIRVIAPDNPYTGCRGRVCEAPYAVPADDAGAPLGYYVRIDGEKGGARPFLAGEIERVRVARVRPPDPAAPRKQRQG
jgi:hypothetical protein